MSNSHCRHCNAELSIEGVPSFRAYRCAGCGELNFFVDEDRRFPGQEIAWRSLWLGIATLVTMIIATALLFLDSQWTGGALGLPAMILGAMALYFSIRAMLRNRYQKAPTSAKIAAAGASFLGGCAGLFWGGLFGFIFAIAVIFNLATVKTTDSAEVAKHAKDYFRVATVDDAKWIPSVAHINPFFSRVEYWDDKLFLQSNSRFYVSWMGTMLTNGPVQNNRKILIDESLERIMGGQQRLVKQDSSRTFDWQINGQEYEVTKQVWVRKKKDGGQEFMTYQATIDTEPRTICLTLLLNLPGETLNDDEVKQIFESFQPED